MKQFIIILAWLTVGTSAYSQSTEYKKFSLAVDIGKDYAVGSPTGGFLYENPDYPSDNGYHPLPFANGLGLSLDGVYFFSQNYGIGIKYHFYNADNFDDKDTFDPDNLFVQFTFDETTHSVGPAFYGRWYSGYSKFEIFADIGVIYAYNKLSSLEKRVYNWMLEVAVVPPIYLRQQYPKVRRPSDMSGSTLGAALSAGVRYRITSTIGICVRANGMFAGLSKQNTNDFFDGPTTIDFSRKLNRIGLSAGLNFNF
ncbi:hypothetical protein AGMMS49982_00870 [Bacteroidia bacterium]|nr:hypothetical protein AGMMS49982_00870 [Bacteroidia bacterium]